MSLKSGISLVVEAPLSYHLEMFRAILSAIFRLLVIFRVHERFKRQEGFDDIPVRELSKSVEWYEEGYGNQKSKNVIR